MLRPVYSWTLLACLAYTAQVASGFTATAPVALRANRAMSMQLRRPAAGVSSLNAKTFDTNPTGEDRHHPYFDAPEDKIAKAGKLSVGKAPPEPNADFRRNHPDFDAPAEKLVAAGNVKGAGAAAAMSTAEPAFFDAPLDRAAAAGNIVTNTPPPAPNADFKRNHPDWDPPKTK